MIRIVLILPRKSPLVLLRRSLLQALMIRGKDKTALTTANLRSLDKSRAMAKLKSLAMGKLKSLAMAKLKSLVMARLKVMW
jgi:hypothetical protein